MTSKQRMSILLDRWPRACRAQGWDPQDRDLRLQVIGQAVGRQVRTMNDLDNAADIDALFAHLGRLSDNVARTVETLEAPTFTATVGRQRRAITVKDTPGLRRRLLWLMREHARPLGGDAYVIALPQCAHICAGGSLIEDLPTQSLYQLVKTLNARRRSKAAKAPEPEAALAEAAMDPNVPF